MKSDVYSWRVDPDLRRKLEDLAHERGVSIAALLDEAALSLFRERSEGDTGIEAIRARALACAGKASLPEGYSKERLRAKFRAARNAS